MKFGILRLYIFLVRYNRFDSLYHPLPLEILNKVLDPVKKGRLRLLLPLHLSLHRAQFLLTEAFAK